MSVQQDSMAWSILLPSVNDHLNSTESLGGSSILRPMTKFHAVGQDKYTGDYITVYMHTAILVGSSRRFLTNDRVTLNLFFLSTWSLLCGGQHRVGAVNLLLTQR